MRPPPLPSIRRSALPGLTILVLGFYLLCSSLLYTANLFVVPVVSSVSRNTVSNGLSVRAVDHTFQPSVFPTGLGRRFLDILALGGALTVSSMIASQIKRRANGAKFAVESATSSPPGLHVSNLHATLTEAPDVSILNGVTLDLQPGEVVALLGPNGCGKSTFARVLMGDAQYEVTHGDVEMNGTDVLELEVDERASNLGMFMSWQAPVEIPGLTNFTLLHAALNASRKSRGLTELSPFEFYSFAKNRLTEVERGEELISYLNRPVNTGMSGGERKRVELLHAVVLRPRLCIFDEIDSGLDVDALKQVATTLRSLREVEPSMTMLIVSHYKRMFDELQPSRVLVMQEGVVVHQGGPELITEVDEGGFKRDWFRESNDDDPKNSIN